MADGVRLAADLYLPDDGRDELSVADAAAGRGRLHPVPQGRGQPVGEPPLPLSRAPRLHPGPGRHPGNRRLGGRQHRRVHAPGAARRRGRGGMAGRAGLVRRPRQPDGHLVRRLHGAPGRGSAAAAPDQHHPGRLHGRPLHGRLPLPRRPAADVLRHRLVRHADDRLERDAAGPRVVARRLGRRLGTAHRRERALPPEVARAPDRWAVLAERIRRRRLGDRLPHVPDRRLARRLPEPAAAALSDRWRPAGCRSRCSSGRGTTPIRTRRSPARGSTTCARWCAGWTTGARASRTASWTSRRSSSTCSAPSRRSSIDSMRQASGGPRRPGRRPARGPSRCTSPRTGGWRASRARRATMRWPITRPSA